MSDPFAAARAVADAVLAEGQVLYPYRASALKNRMRWQFGVLGPPGLADEPGADASWCQTQVVCTGSSVRALVRFLRLDGGDWASATLHEIALPGPSTDPWRSELRHDGSTVTVTVHNTDPLDAARDRDHALVHSLIGVHVILVCDDGEFASAVDPPPHLAADVAACRNERLWPVLVGRQSMLAAPIILYDQPAIAPESVGQWGDALEIEEMLVLRVLTLTDDEKAEAAATDPFAAAVVAQSQPDRLHGLHGRVRRGEQVVLRPKPGADAHDLFLEGRTATVIDRVVDAEGHELVQVTIDDDPGRDLHEWFGRRWFFRPDELEPQA